MSRPARIAAVLTVALVVAAWFLFRGVGSHGSSAHAPRAGNDAADVDSTPSHDPHPAEARGASLPGARTPDLEQAPGAADGLLEVAVFSGGRPVRGAEVRLYWRGATDPNTQEVAWRAAGHQTTSAQGIARLAAGPGAYLVAAHLAGRATARAQVVRPFNEPLTRVRLTLEPGSTLSGTTVVKGTREPVALAQLELIQLTGADGRQAEAPSEERIFASSDPYGRFRIDSLAEGLYRIEATAPGIGHALVRSVAVPRATPLTLELVRASTLEGFVTHADGTAAPDAEVMAAGREPSVGTTGPGGGFALEVQPGTYQLSARSDGRGGALKAPVSVAPGATVKGLRIVLGAAASLEGVVTAKRGGRPVAGAAIAVSPHGQNGDTARGATGADGRFSIAGLAPGSYDLVVTAAGFDEQVTSGISVDPGQTFPLQISLEGTGAVEGKVTDPGGRPVVGARVSGGERWSGSLGSAPAETRSGADGAYRLEGLSSGPVRVMALRDPDRLGVSRTVDVADGETTHLDLVLDESGTIYGRVTGADGGPPPEGTIVNLFSMQIRNGEGGFATSPVASDGSYQVSVPPGTYSLWPFVEGRPRTGVRRGDVQVQVEAGARVQKDLVLPPEGKGVLKGHVLEPNGAPSIGAFVWLRKGRTMRTMMATDESGAFAFQLSDESGEEVVLRATNGGRTGERSLSGVPTSDVTVQLQAAATLHGRVTGLGDPNASFTVVTRTSAAWMPGGSEGLQFIGEDFDLPDVAPGRVQVTVTTTDGRTGSASVTLAPGEAGQIEIALQPGATASGIVVDDAHRPRAGVWLSVDSGMRRSGVKRSGADGSFRIEDLGPGKHVVRAYAPDGASAARRFEVAPGEQQSLGELVLVPRASRADDQGH